LLLLPLLRRIGLLAHETLQQYPAQQQTNSDYDEIVFEFGYIGTEEQKRSNACKQAHQATDEEETTTAKLHSPIPLLTDAGGISP
jgi:hypothetical protein